MTHETREQLEDAVFDAYPSIDMDVIESFTVQELRHLLAKLKPEVIEPKQVAHEPKQSAVKPMSVKVEPQTLADAFTVSNGRLMRRIVTRQTLGQFSTDIVHLAPTGEQARFAGRTYRTSHILHWLQTGQWVLRINKVKRVQRYRARVYTPNGLVHLGYFASQSERDAAVFEHKLGITPSK